ncbi:hypothetical protein ACQCT3_17905 [Sutcliffiella horikoshii]
MSTTFDEYDYVETVKSEFCEIEIYVDRKTDEKIVDKKIRDYLELLYK